MLYINRETGIESELSDATIAALKRANEWHKFDETPLVLTGQGEGTCLYLERNGIGDAVYALPALSSYKGDISCTHFLAPLYELLGHTTNRLKLHELTRQYKTIYNLSYWCTRHDQETKGEVYKTRFSQIADLANLSLPYSFSWRDLFNFGEPRRDKIYSSLNSTSPWRSYKHDLPFEKMPTFHNVLDLVETVYHARGIVAVDNGVLQLALALETPCVGLFGMTDEVTIVKQYERYVSGRVLILRSEVEEACRPCSAQEAKGWQVNGKCKNEADCMRDLHPEHVTNKISEFFVLN